MSHRGAVPAARIAAMALAGLIGIGCGGGANRAQPGAAAGRRPAFAPEMRQQLLTSAVAVLRELDRYEPQRGREQVFDRLVQWHAAAKADARRERTPKGMADPDLFGSLPERLRQAAADAVERESFDGMDDIQFIRDRCWLEAIARSRGAGAGDELALAERLFDWTVRSLAAVGDPPMVPGDKEPGSRWFFPGEILLSGRASGPQRAWIFLELLRQAGLDGVMLALPGAEGEASRAWLPAVVIGGEAYLFEPTYGMAIPGPGGKGVATARQAAADPSVLESLSLPDRRYPVQASDLVSGLDVLLAAEPRNLAPRMAALDRDLAAAHGIRLVVAAKDLSARAAAAIPGDRVAVVGLWTFPWETFARRPLAARPLEEDLGPLAVPAGEPPFPALFAGRVREFRGAYAEAKQAYLSARLTQRRVSQGATGLPGPQAAVVSRLAERMKEDATYWLGMLMVAEGENEAAADYLGRMTLEAAPDSRWTDAARIGLAGALVGLGRGAEAAALLREDGSPQRFGSRLRAAGIESKLRSSPGSRNSPSQSRPGLFSPGDARETPMVSWADRCPVLRRGRCSQIRWPRHDASGILPIHSSFALLRPCRPSTMKDGIHPDYVHTVVRCGCGNTFATRSTVPEIKVDICNACHPFFTGKLKFVDTAGRIEKFKSKFASAGYASLKKKKGAATEASAS